MRKSMMNTAAVLGILFSFSMGLGGATTATADGPPTAEKCGGCDSTGGTSQTCGSCNGSVITPTDCTQCCAGTTCSTRFGTSSGGQGSQESIPGEKGRPAA